MPTLVTSAKVAGGSGGTTPARNTTGANYLVVSISHFGVVANTPTDTYSNSWNSVLSANGPWLFYAENAIVGTNHTVTFSQASTFAVVIFAAFSGVKTSSSLDQSAVSANTSSNTRQPGSILPTENGELILTNLRVASSFAGLAINSGFSIIESQDFVGGNNYAGALAYLIQATAASINPTWSWTTVGTNSAKIYSAKEEPIVGGFVDNTMNIIRNIHGIAI